MSRYLVAVSLLLASCHPSRVWTLGDPGGRVAPGDAAVAPDATGFQPSVCSDIPIPVNNPEVEVPRCPRDPCDSGITCRKEANGELVMSYTIACQDDQRAWAVCEFSVDQDFAVFDIAHGNRGVIEAVFCVEDAAVVGAVNLWYGRHPLRKKLTLLPRGEMLDPGCYLRTFSPAQARFPEWEGIPSSCGNLCGAGNAGCSEEFQDSIAGYTADAGRGFDLRATLVQLAVEDCSDTAVGRIRLKTVRYLSEGCLCSSAGDCGKPDRPTCRMAEPADCGPWPENLLPGVCGPAVLGCTGKPGAGVPCTVDVGGQTCMAVTECVDGQYVCPISDCE